MRRADGDEIGTVLGIVVILQADGFPAGEGRDVHRRDLRTKVPKIRVKGRAARVCRPYGMAVPVSRWWRAARVCRPYGMTGPIPP